MTRRRLAIILVAIIVLIALIVMAWSIRSDRPTVQRIAMDISVGDSYAFNLDTDAVHFGRTSPGNPAIRGIIVNNTKGFDVVARIAAEGEIAAWVVADSQDFRVPSFTARHVNLTATVPAGTPYGKYTGTLIITFTKVP